MDFPNGVMVTLRSTTTTEDGLGNTETVVSNTSWGPCAVAPRYARESADPNVAPVVVGKVVYGPTRAIDDDDLIIIDDVTYRVDGLPAEWVSPFTGWDPGMEVPIKRTP